MLEPDGLSNFYYKCFEEKRLQSQQKMMNYIQQGGKLPVNWRKNNMALTPTEGQDMILTRNYKSL